MFMGKDTFTIQETLACYQSWNEAERQERLINAGKKSPEQKWQEYLDIMEFGMMIKPEPSLHEHRQKIEMLNRYYEQIELFEERRKQHEA
jgi:hypothetical protein